MYIICVATSQSLPPAHTRNSKRINAFTSSARTPNFITPSSLPTHTQYTPAYHHITHTYTPTQYLHNDARLVIMYTTSISIVYSYDDLLYAYVLSNNDHQ